MLISELKNGDKFKIPAGQTLWYLPQGHRIGPHGSAYESNGHTVFEVLKQNDMSIKVKPIDGRVEYYFKYKGMINNDKVVCTQCAVEKVEE